MSNILEGLNEEQLKAVQSVDGAYRLIAGAGSGKTHTLTKRVAYICESKDIDPKRVLCLTFTNKAAKDMSERLAKLMGVTSDSFYMSTYHHFAYDVLKRDSKTVFGWDSINICQVTASVLVPEWMDKHKELFEGVSDEDRSVLSTYLVNKVNKTLASDYYVEWLDKSYGVIPLASVKEVLAYHEKDVASRKAFESYKRVVQKYDDTEKIRASAMKMEDARIKYNEGEVTPIGTWVRSVIQSKNGYVTFDDIIKMAVYLLENYEEVREYWQNQFDYVQCDEFQDTDMRQLRMVQAVYKKHGNLFVVGDPDQSIYLFRGAEPSILTNLGEYIPNLQTIFMGNNYRSTEEVVSVSDKVIEMNKNRIQKKCTSMSGNGSNVEVICGGDGNTVALSECKIIEGLLSEGVEPSQIAILYSNKTDITTNILQNMLEVRGIAFSTTLVSDTTYRDFTLNMCKFKHTGKKKFMYDAINTLGINDRFLDLSSLNNVECTVEVIFGICDSLQKCLKKTDGKPTASYQRFLNQQPRIEEDIKGALDYWQGLSNGGKDSLCTENSEELLGGMQPPEGEGISILTIHRSKGLEWDYVFVNGLENSTFISSRDNGDVRLEKARLAYVGYSRAKKGLYIGSSDGENLGSVVAQVIDEPYVSIGSEFSEETLQEMKERSLSEYYSGVDEKQGIEYNPLVLGGEIVGYRCSYYIDGEKVCYQATIEDLERLDCVPKESILLVKVGRGINVVQRSTDKSLYTSDYLDNIVHIVTLTEDRDILTVFGNSNKPYTKDIKDYSEMCELATKKADSPAVKITLHNGNSVLNPFEMNSRKSDINLSIVSNR